MPRQAPTRGIVGVQDEVSERGRMIGQRQKQGSTPAALEGGLARTYFTTPSRRQLAGISFSLCDRRDTPEIGLCQVRQTPQANNTAHVKPPIRVSFGARTAEDRTPYQSVLSPCSLARREAIIP